MSSLTDIGLRLQWWGGGAVAAGGGGGIAFVRVQVGIHARNRVAKAAAAAAAAVVVSRTIEAVAVVLRLLW